MSYAEENSSHLSPASGVQYSRLLFSVLQDDSTGEMIFDEVFHALSRCLAGLVQPFKVPGTDRFFKPKIFITILAYSSIIGLTSHQVMKVIFNLTPRKAEFLSSARVYCPTHTGVECFMLTLISLFTIFGFTFQPPKHLLG